MEPKQESSQKRKKWSIEEKLTIIRKHFSRSKLVETCEEFRVHPSVINDWWKTILEAGREALSGKDKSKVNQLEKRIKEYEQELSKKNEVIVELTQEVLVYKKKQNGVR
jgi:transposase-like protein